AGPADENVAIVRGGGEGDFAPVRQFVVAGADAGVAEGIVSGIGDVAVAAADDGQAQRARNGIDTGLVFDRTDIAFGVAAAAVAIRGSRITALIRGQRGTPQRGAGAVLAAVDGQPAGSRQEGLQHQRAGVVAVVTELEQTRIGDIAVIAGKPTTGRPAVDVEAVRDVLAVVEFATGGLRADATGPDDAVRHLD